MGGPKDGLQIVLTSADPRISFPIETAEPLGVGNPAEAPRRPIRSTNLRHWYVVTTVTPEFATYRYDGVL